MTEHRSFRPSDFSIRDVPGFVVVYLGIALVSIGLGVLLESLPKFWSGAFFGAGSALLAVFFLLRPAEREIDLSALPPPSASVLAKCDDPACSFVEAVKAYREQTGLGLAEATAVVRDYQARKQHRDRVQS